MAIEIKKNGKSFVMEVPLPTLQSSKIVIPYPIIITTN